MLTKTEFLGEDEVRLKRVFGRLLGVEGEVIEDVAFDAAELELEVSVRPRKNGRLRCGQCGAVSAVYDRGTLGRRWRALDLGTVKTTIIMDLPRVACSEHGPTAARVSWARHRSRFTRRFEDVVAWLTTRMDRTAVAKLMRTTWRSTTAIASRVAKELFGATDRLDGLRRIGIDEVSYKKRHNYLTIVVDHDRGRLVWAGVGRKRKTVEAFLAELGPERCAQLQLVSADAANWILPAVREHCPRATICMDPFHVVQWCGAALDEVRRQQWRELRKADPKGQALSLHRSRFALWKDPSKLTPMQSTTLARIQKLNSPLFRAYLLKEQLREVFRLKGPDGVALLDRWLAWASRSRLKPFVKLGRKIRKRKADVVAALVHRLSNARTESMNTRIRLLERQAFGFKSAETLIGLAMLKVGGLDLRLPDR